MIIGIIGNRSTGSYILAEMFKMLLSKEYDDHEIIYDIEHEFYFKEKEWKVKTFADTISKIAHEQFYKCLLENKTQIEVNTLGFITEMYKDYSNQNWIIPDVTLAEEVSSITWRGGCLVKLLKTDTVTSIPANKTFTSYHYNNVEGNEALLEFAKKVLTKLKLI